jgi:uncharacterized protein YkwD
VYATLYGRFYTLYLHNMVHNPLAKSVISPVALGGILIFAVLTAIPSNNRTFASPTSSEESTDAGTAPSSSEESNNTDFINTILGIHNRERAAVGVPALVWSDILAADAQEYADHLVATGKFEHMWESESTEWSQKAHGANENLAWQGGHSTDPAAQAALAEFWVNEKKDFHGTYNGAVNGHYTQMIWKATTELGCGIATGPGAGLYGWNGDRDVLVCRYLPSGNSGLDPFA